MRGSIRRRGKASWAIQVELNRVAGKRRRRFITVRGTYKDAQRELTRLLNVADAGSLSSDPVQMSVAQYLRARLDSALDLSPKTLERYGELAEHQIIPHLGEIKLQKLQPEHIEAWHSKLLRDGLATRTIEHAHKLLAVSSGALLRTVR